MWAGAENEDNAPPLSTAKSIRLELLDRKFIDLHSVSHDILVCCGDGGISDVIFPTNSHQQLSR